MKQIVYDEYHEFLKARTFKSKLYRKYLLFPRLCKFLTGKALDVGPGIGDFVAFVGAAAMIIGIVMVVWAKTGVEDKEIFFHILGFAEGTLVGQVVNYYFGSAKK